MEEDENFKQQVLQSTVAEVKQSHDSSAEFCVICLESVSEPALALPCRHESFDFLCLISWLQEQSSCPLCKVKVHSVEYHRQNSGGCQVYRVPDTSASTSSRSAGPIRESFQDTSGRYRIQRNRRRRDLRRVTAKPDAALIGRREVYQRQIYSCHVGSNRISRFRDLTPQMFARDNELVSRAKKWIRRELQVFEYLDGNMTASPEGATRRANNAEFLLEYIIAILKTVNIKGSAGQADDMLSEFIGRENSRLFLHELRAWLRSPYTDLRDWDRWVQYPESSCSGPSESDRAHGNDVVS